MMGKLKSLIAVVLATQMLLGFEYAHNIPETPGNTMMIYIHSGGGITLSKGRVARSKYNYSDDISNKISADNPDAIVVAANYSQALHNEINRLIEENSIERVVVSGWSTGGSRALQLASDLVTDFEGIEVTLLALDSNQMDEIPDRTYNNLEDHGVKIFYLAREVNRFKDRKIRKLIAYKDISYIVYHIPPEVTSVPNRRVRDSAIDYNLYGYVLGTNTLADCFDLYRYEDGWQMVEP